MARRRPRPCPLLAQGHRKRREAHRAAVEALDDRTQERTVRSLQSAAVDLEQLESLARDLGGDDALVAHFLQHPALGGGSGSRPAGFRERRAISSAASSPISTPRIPAERRTISASSSGS